MKTIVKMKFGSHLYGTNTPTSDTDIKAVHLEDMDRLFLMRTRSVINNSTNQNKKEFEKNKSEDVDYESYELNKYVNLLCEGQTVALDMLFAPRSAWLESSWEWEMLVLNKHLFLTKKAQSFIGYCRTQANKYGIKGSRVAAAREAVAFFEGMIFHFGNHAILKDYSDAIIIWAASLNNEHIKIIRPDSENNQKEVMVEVCNRKCQFGNSAKNALEMFKRILDEYGSRSLEAEKNEGVDWKALSHAVRIGEQALELFLTGSVVFPRHNRAELLAIKKGLVDYRVVASRIEELLDLVEVAAKNSNLPDDVDRDKIDGMVCGMYYQSLLPRFKNGT